MADGYRRVSLRKALIDEAVRRAENLPVFENSHRGPHANLVGCIGEVVFERFLEHHGIDYVNVTGSTRRDYVVRGAISLDVKTNDRTVAPRRSYENLVPL